MSGLSWRSRGTATDGRLSHPRRVPYRVAMGLASLRADGASAGGSRAGATASTIALMLVFPSLLCLAHCTGQVRVDCGPMLGHTTPTTAKIWARISEPGLCLLEVSGTGAPGGRRIRAEARRETHLTLTWQIGKLLPDASCTYRITRNGRPLPGGGPFKFRTPPPHDRPAVVRLAVGSCADIRRFPVQPIWKRIAAVRRPPFSRLPVRRQKPIRRASLQQLRHCIPLLPA